MDLSAAISYNGVTLLPASASPTQDRSGYEIDTIDVSRVQADGYLDPRALQDGLDAADIYRRGRTIEIAANVVGRSAGDAWDRVQELLAAFSPTIAYNADTANLGFLPLAFQQATLHTSTWSAGYIPLAYYARPVSDVRYTVNRARQSDNGRGFVIPVAMSLICRDPRKYLSTGTTSLNLSTATQTATYRGDYNSLPIITVTMSAAGATNFTIVTSSDSVVINLSTRSTGTLTLDFSKRTLVSGATSYSGLISSASGYPSIKQGSTIRIANTTGVSACSMAYREAWA